jgi:hypothetical protein
MKPPTNAIKLTSLKTFLALMALIFMMEAGYAQVFEFSGTRKKDVVNFSLIKNLIFFPVYII